MAEERILKSVQLTVFQKNASGSMTSDNQFLAVPSDFISPLSLSITNSSNFDFLLFKDIEFVQPYGDLFAIGMQDKALSEIVEPRKIRFVTDKNGFTKLFIRAANLVFQGIHY